MGRVNPSTMPLIFDSSAVAVVFIVRTYAVWKRDRRVGIGLALLFILCQTAMGVIMEMWITTAHGGYCIDYLSYSTLRER